jgi:hypothetical protein
MMPMFPKVPEAAELTQTQLQKLCTAWLETPVAQEFCVRRLTVLPDLSHSFTVELADGHGEAYEFPLDDLLEFVRTRSSRTD